MKTALTAFAAAGLLLLTSNTPVLAAQGGAAPHPSAPAAAAPQTTEPISGTVIETMESGGYTYVRLDTKEDKIWVAVPKMKVKVGEKHAFMPGNVMHDFESKSLKKKFDTIIFSPGPMVLPGTKADASGAEAAPKVKKVDKAKGKNAQTVADCFKNSAKLANKTVEVRGKVVKVSKAIMGKNWVHIQDGTGNSSKGTHDLVATTMDLPNVDDIVTVTGKLVKDKDFGYGYKYDVIIEDAKVSK